MSSQQFLIHIWKSISNSKIWCFLDFSCLLHTLAGKLSVLSLTRHLRRTAWWWWSLSFLLFRNHSFNWLCFPTGSWWFIQVVYTLKCLYTNTIHSIWDCDETIEFLSCHCPQTKFIESDNLRHRLLQRLWIQKKLRTSRSFPQLARLCWL